MKSADVKLTVTITNYNQKEYIVKAVDSILMQELGYSYEILIGDDGSTDGSWELLQSKYSANENIKMYRMPRDFSVKEFANWRHSRLMCFLLREARGQYISMLDGDDYYCSKDGFKRKIDFLESSENRDCIACTSATVFIQQNGKEPQAVPDSWVYKKLTIKQLFYSKVKFYFPLATCVFRRSVLKYIDFEAPELFEADQTVVYFLLHHGRLYVMPEYDFACRILSNSIWHKGNDAEHAIRMTISFNIARKQYSDFYFRRLKKDKKWLLYVYHNKKSIPEQIDWEMWRKFIDKYDLQIVKWLMGNQKVSFKVKVEMKFSMIVLFILNNPPTQVYKYVVGSVGFLFSRSISVTEKKKRMKTVMSRILQIGRK